MESEVTLQSLQAALEWSNKVNMEIFYWWCTAIMVLIHAGFLAYEMGSSRLNNTLASGVKNALAFAFLVPTFYFFGWFIYNAFYGGFVPDMAAGAAALPWSDAMGPNITDNGTGIFWAAFTLFAATTSSIMSGAVLERIRLSGFLILAIMLGSVVWILAAAWGWHPNGWLTARWGFHDTGAAGCVHLVAGAFTLGVLINLGPRVGRFIDGKVMTIAGHSIPMALIGLMLIVCGFFGFLGGCIIYTPGGQWVTIFNTPTTLSAFGFNTLMGVAGGMIGAYAFTRDPFWMMSGALCGVISAAPGLDVYYPPVAFALGFVGSFIATRADKLLLKFKIDDAVGAVAVHGACGVWGLLACGLFASGYPNIAEGAPAVNFLGQLYSTLVLGALGFIPGYVLSYALKAANLLRVPHQAEMAGLDIAEGDLRAYPYTDLHPSAKKPDEVVSGPSIETLGV